MASPSFSHYNSLGVLDSISEDAVEDILESWSGFCTTTESLLQDNLGGGNTSVIQSNFISHVHVLCESYLLTSLVKDHFFRALQETFERSVAKRFWRHFDDIVPISKLNESHKDEVEQVLCRALEYICLEKQYQEKCSLLLLHALESSDKASNFLEEGKHNPDMERLGLFSRYQLMVYSVLTTTLPRHFSEILRFYFMGRLEELSAMMSANANNVHKIQDKEGMNIDESTIISTRVTEMDIDETYRGRKFSENSKIVKDIGKVVRDLRSLGFTSMTEDAYASSIFLLLKTKVHDLASDDYRSSVLDSIKEWIRNVPLQYLYMLLAYLGESVGYDSPSSGLKSPLASHPSFHCGTDTPSEGLVRWQLRLEYFAYETLQDLRIAKLFEIIVDYPDSSPAIDDLKQCLKYTGQHSKLVDSFISSLRYRLLTAGASTNDILHQYVSTIKALRIIDPTGVFLEAVGEPIRDYLKGRKDTRKCIVSMLTEGPGGNPNGPGNIVDSLLEELNRDEENQETGISEDDYNCDDKQAWINAECWEPDPVEADPSKGSMIRRKIDILGMVVGIIGSKEQLVNEYQVMLAEKLLNKSDYDIDPEIRTLELLKIHFGEICMQKCEIMLNDLIHSKRINTNIKASVGQSLQEGTDKGETEMSLDLLDATIISSNFWPPVQGLPEGLTFQLGCSMAVASAAIIHHFEKNTSLSQEESINIPKTMDQLLCDYAKRFNAIKTPRKLLWKKNLGVVKLELQFGDATTQFTVDPVNAAIIIQFQGRTSWTSKDLAEAVGVPVETLHRRINFWISKGVISESNGAEADDRKFTLLDSVSDSSKNSMDDASCEDLRADEEGETCFASQEQLRREMVVYEKFILGMLTNFGSMTLDQCHNNLKRFCSDAYDKSLQQLQSFLLGLQSEEKIELRDGLYYLRR